jgi:hypothetical protein
MDGRVSMYLRTRSAMLSGAFFRRSRLAIDGGDEVPLL